MTVYNSVAQYYNRDASLHYTIYPNILTVIILSVILLSVVAPLEEVGLPLMPHMELAKHLIIATDKHSSLVDASKTQQRFLCNNTPKIEFSTKYITDKITFIY
jgi:hypothetical protein